MNILDLPFFYIDIHDMPYIISENIISNLMNF